MHKRILVLLLLIPLVACQRMPEPEGLLTGHVSIGPLQPTLQLGVPEPTPHAEVFAARRIVILDQQGRREIVHVPIQSDGTYEIMLPEGIYTVDINHTGLDHADGLPALVEILASEVTRLDITIDTGIR